MLPIGMAEMNRIFEISDDLEISREGLQVELLPAGGGSVTRLANGRIRIVLPEDRPLDEWLPDLRRLLQEARAEP